MMHQELVEKRRWISEQRFLHALNYCMLLPGPEAIQLAIYISWLLHGIPGALMAGILFFLPAFVLLSLLAALYLHFADLPLLLALFQGIKPAVVAVVLFAAWRIGSKTVHNAVLLAIAILAFIGIFLFNIDFPWIILTAALLGIWGGKFAPHLFHSSAPQHSHNQKQYGPALLDDDSPPPAHARFSWNKLLLMLIIFIIIWAGALWLVHGQQTLYSMGLFFSKAAFLTIGGAYAVLPYVYQGAVEEFHWLNGTQMIDGLALGETTPGPLIMIVTWVGYLGGVAHQVAAQPLAAGLAGATVATFFTFLPSFLFILAGGPLVESSRDNRQFSAPLTAISAAVVGVIVNLALFFAWHTFWPQATAAEPFAAPLQWSAVLIAAASFIALWKLKLEIMLVIACCAILGTLQVWIG